MYEDQLITDIFFDLDHTLWDFERNSALTFRQLLAQRFPALDPEVFLQHYIPSNLYYWRLFRHNQIGIEELRYARLKRVFDALNMQVSDADIHELAVDYLTVLPSFNHLFEDVIEILNYLKIRYRLHIITNGFAQVQERKLQNSGIASFFSVVVNSETVGVKKPHPQIFEHALDLAGVSPERALMVGDSLEADIYGALHVGMQVMFFNPEGNEAPSGILSIRQWSDVKNLL